MIIKNKYYQEIIKSNHFFLWPILRFLFMEEIDGVGLEYPKLL